MPPSLGDRLAHILTAIDDIRALMQDCSLADFESDRMRRMAVERLLEIISEASRFIPNDMKKLENSIPCRRVADLGNRLRHAYHRIEPEILWNIIQSDLEPLESFVKRITHEPQ